MLVSSDWRGADLGELARQQLAPHLTDNPNRLHLKGEPILLPADLATPFGLVMHELATNAAKYGSLSALSGTVGLSWTVDTRNKPRRLRLVWEERGGPPPGQPKSGGFGSALIDSVIPAAHVDREFRPEGLVCTVEAELPETPEDGGAV